MTRSHGCRLTFGIAAVAIWLVGCRPAVTQGQSDGAPSTQDAAAPTIAEQAVVGTKGGPSMPGKRSRTGYDLTPMPHDKVEELAARLDPEAYRVTQRAGTEPAFCGGLLNHKGDGTYACAVCGLPLFASSDKFESGTGWPSFKREFDPAHVARVPDNSYGMVRTEIRCARCGAHLGHVFDDGPAPTGQRHCLNSAALKFFEKGTEPKPDAGNAKTEVAYFAGGCFWGLEHYFQQGPGVIDAVSGYMQGSTDKPTYEQVCDDSTGHAETVKVVFDPEKISFRRLLEAFFDMHDPTQLDRQGPDVGSQYRSGIWVVGEEQRRQAEAVIAELAAQKRFGGRPIVTRVETAKTFFPAEDYHQDYVSRTGRACHVRDPWRK